MQGVLCAFVQQYRYHYHHGRCAEEAINEEGRHAATSKEKKGPLLFEHFNLKQFNLKRHPSGQRHRRRRRPRMQTADDQR